MSTWRAGVGLSLLLLLPGEAAGQSFDCSQAGTEAEELVCSDAELGALDEKLAAAFAAALESFPPEELATLRAYQRGWIKGRDDCWKANDVRDCVEYSYRIRIVELQIQTGQLTAPEPIGYRCEGADESVPFMAAFYGQTDPEAVVLTYGDSQVIALRNAEAETPEYAAAGISFRELEGAAAVSWFGTEMLCSPR